MAAALEQANGGVMPTSRLTSVEAAYWTTSAPRSTCAGSCRDPEDQLLDALARLHAAGRGVRRRGLPVRRDVPRHGLLAPVWDLPVGTGAEVLEEPAASSPPPSRRR